MTAQPLHTKLINAAAREVLGPLGLVQSGRSRLWTDDHGWWLIGVDFEPSGFSKGTYLTVSVMWLWTEEQGFGAHFGGRVHRSGGLFHHRGGEEFVAFQTEEQFAPEAHRLAGAAAERVMMYRALFADLAHIPVLLLDHRKGKTEGGPRDVYHDAYHVAVAYGLLGHAPQARAFFARACIVPATVGWHHQHNDLIQPHPHRLPHWA